MNVLEYNVIVFMYEVMMGEKYVLLKIDEKKVKYGKVILYEVKEEEEDDEKEVQELKSLEERGVNDIKCEI